MKPPQARHGEVRQAGVVYIIGGQWRRTRLQVLNAPGTRPTPNRVRETLFNWLGQDLHGWHCLDVFAGSGALGFEAGSRGAAAVTLCETNGAQVAQLRSVQMRLAATNLTVLQQDGMTALSAAAAGSLDLVLLDPPFSSDLFSPALVAARRAIKSTGMIYLEAPSQWGSAQLAALGLSVWRHLHAGSVHAHLLVPQSRTPD